MSSGDHLLAFFEIQLVRIHTLGLGYQEEGDDGTEEVAGEEDPEDVCDANVAGRTQVVEQHARENGAEFAGGGTHSVGETTDAGGEEFSGDDERGGVGTEVEEHLESRCQLGSSLLVSFCVEEILAHLGNCEADEFASGSEMVVVARNDSKHERADQEALNLDPASAKDLDEENGQEVARDVARCSDDEISVRVLK